MPDSTDHDNATAYRAAWRAEHDQHSALGFDHVSCPLCLDDELNGTGLRTDNRETRDNGYVLAWNVHPSYLHDGLARNYLDHFGLTPDDVFAHLD